MATLARYGAVGLLTFAVYAAVGLAARRAGLPLIAEASIAFAMAVTINYWLQRVWVFRDRRSPSATLPRYVAMIVLGYALNLGTLAALSTLPHVLAQLCAVTVVVVSNACLSFCWVFLTGAAARPS